MSTLSVIIPAKDEAEVLPVLLESLAAQTRQPDEVIVADANSTDATRDIAKQFGAKVVEGGLPGPGRNAGAEAATSDILLFMDADVQLPGNNVLEKAVKEFEERRLDVAAADMKPYDGNAFDKFAHEVYNKYVRMVNPLKAHANGAFIMIRRQLHDEIGGFDETVVFCEDHDYACRGSKAGEFGVLDSIAIGVTTRRMDRDGRLVIASKFILGELHLLAIGPIRHDAFNYTFGYKKD